MLPSLSKEHNEKIFFFFYLQLIWIYIGTLLRCIIIIDPQVIFNCEKLISLICGLIIIAHINKYTDMYRKNHLMENLRVEQMRKTSKMTIRD
jgi:hypothetical protein